jgi:hypothetical protein
MLFDNASLPIELEHDVHFELSDSSQDLQLDSILHETHL